MVPLADPENPGGWGWGQQYVTEGHQSSRYVGGSWLYMCVSVCLPLDPPLGTVQSKVIRIGLRYLS